jgi:hypothetical protein
VATVKEEELMARKKKQVVAASLNPDEMSSGLADDFDGEITKARFVPWNYAGKMDEYVLAAAITFTPDEESGFEEFTEYFSAGKLEDFQPSEDGEEPVDLDSWDGEDVEEVEGVYAVPVGRRTQLSGGSNVAHFIRAMLDAGFDGVEASLDFMEGVSGHFNRVPQRKRSGIQTDQVEGRERTILVLTEYDDSGAKTTTKKTAKRGSKKTTARKTNAKPTADDDLIEAVSDVIVEALGDNEGELSKRDIASLVIGAFKGKKNKSQAVKMASSADFLSESELWTFDADEGVLYEV